MNLRAVRVATEKVAVDTTSSSPASRLLCRDDFHQTNNGPRRYPFYTWEKSTRTGSTFDQTTGPGSGAGPVQSPRKAIVCANFYVEKTCKPSKTAFKNRHLRNLRQRCPDVPKMTIWLGETPRLFIAVILIYQVVNAISISGQQ